MQIRFLTLVVLFGLVRWTDAQHASEPAVSFNRDIRPILSDKCLACHGPDAAAREADLRLDDRAATVADRGGYAVIVPGDEAASQLIKRITTPHAAERMPPPESNKQLTPREIELLRAWVRQGAEYEKHWAFQPLAKPPVPLLPPRRSPAASNTLQNPIDAFVSAELRLHGLEFAREAAPDTLLRRVTLDLTGLPPTRDDLAAFRAELARPGADPDECYVRLVDRLLASPHFGEHFAAVWLDAARYADTNGYFGDKPRQMWLWRDWLIRALNANMPFDQFTIEQLAGDLLPEPTIEQRIATGFNRNHMANNETGIIDEEFRVEYVADRVHTTMTAWLGISAGCAQCHDHKFDPISQREFYQLFAFFNNVPEQGLIYADNPPPLLSVPSPEQEHRLTQLARESREAVEAFEPVKKELAAAITDWESQAVETLPRPPAESVAFYAPFDASIPSGATAIGTTVAFERGVHGQAAKFDATQHIETNLAAFDPDGPWTIGLWIKPDGQLSCPLSLIEPAGNRRGIELLLGKGILKLHLVHDWAVNLIQVATAEPLSSKHWHHVVVSYDGSRAARGVTIAVDGRRVKLNVERDSLSETMANGEPLRIGRRDSGLGYYGQIDEVRVLGRQVDDRAIEDWFWGERIRGILNVSAADRAAADSDILLDYYVDLFADDTARAAREHVKQTRLAEQQLRAAIPTVLVMQEMDKPRDTRVLERGEYNKPGERVEPGVPAAIAPWPDGEPANRLGFARWLVSAENPLTARVAVNRLWQHCFGHGLVRTVDDFGSQGEPPTHPELLDWLAATFRDTGWDTKRLVRQIVTSRTYKQSSRFETSGGQVFDPDNRLLARGPSVRLSAEMLRDQSLAVAGLLVRQIGGPSVKPYQPPGLWEAVSYDGEDSYEPNTDDGLWRRSVYTYIKRQAPPPTLLTFDAPTREKCTMQRARTNTPLQALVLLNDDTYVEAARWLAAETLAEAGSDRQRLASLFQAVLLRDPHEDETDLLTGLLDRQRRRFAGDCDGARQLISVGASPCQSNDPCELAAWTVVAQTLLNLDESIMKR